MPNQNRVTPFSNLIRTPARGTLTGNRGCLHDDAGRIRRDFLGKRWIICRLSFKGRHRQIMTPGHYTELFFLDEATALAAGHRPCAECQRERFNLFRNLWSIANPGLAQTKPLPAPTLDGYLHEERNRSMPQINQALPEAKELPNGAFVADPANNAYLVLEGRFFLWRPEGYYGQPLINLLEPIQLLTPASIIAALKAGFPVDIHPTAF